MKKESFASGGGGRPVIKWQEIGDTLRGRFIKSTQGQYGTLFVFENDEGEEVLLPDNVDLAELVDNEAELAGQLLEIELIEWAKTKAGHSVKRYRKDRVIEEEAKHEG